MNRMFLVGNVGQEPDIKYFDSGDCKTTFSVAYSEYKKDKDNVTHWFNCEVWGKRAEVAMDFLKKGSKVAIEGTVLTDEYEKDGNKVKRTYIKVSDFEFMSGKDNEKKA